MWFRVLLVAIMLAMLAVGIRMAYLASELVALSK